MIITSTQLIEVILGAAKNTNDCPWMASYADTTTSAFTPASATGVTNGLTAVQMIAAPAGSTQRHIKWINIQNADVVAITVMVRINTSSVFTNLIRTSLGVNESLSWSTETGWMVLTVNGEIKGSTGAPGRFIRQVVYTTGTGATHTFTAGCGAAVIEAVAQGGGGGGATFSSPNMGFGGGGAAGGYFSIRIVTPPATATYTVGTAGGAGGANTGGTGGTGSDTTVTVGATTYTAKGGTGGVGLAAGTGLIFILGGSGVAGTNGDILSPGAPGQPAVRLSGILGGSGNGGSSVFGAGGQGKTANGVGNAGGGYGAGGGGAAAVSGSQTGGVGSGGIVIITEYS